MYNQTLLSLFISLSCIYTFICVIYSYVYRSIKWNDEENFSTIFDKS